MSENHKYYVVWDGHAPGIYDSWDECRCQVEGYPNAKYRSYSSLEAATEAFRGNAYDELAFARALRERIVRPEPVAVLDNPDIRLDAVAVDGACSKNPGPMEYRCVRVIDGVEVFRVGPLAGGTNNIGEYLAIIHAAALLARRGLTDTPIYTDSVTALSWVRRGHSNTKLTPTAENEAVRTLLARADAWIASNRIVNPLLKWDTERWGEIPADFGRK